MTNDNRDAASSDSWVDDGSTSDGDEAGDRANDGSGDIELVTDKDDVEFIHTIDCAADGETATGAADDTIAGDISTTADDNGEIGRTSND